MPTTDDTSGPIVLWGTRGESGHIYGAEYMPRPIGKHHQDMAFSGYCLTLRGCGSTWRGATKVRGGRSRRGERQNMVTITLAVGRRLRSQSGGICIDSVPRGLSTPATVIGTLPSDTLRRSAYRILHSGGGAGWREGTHSKQGYSTDGHISRLTYLPLPLSGGLGLLFKR
jgi:hypothetical protein